MGGHNSASSQQELSMVPDRLSSFASDAARLRVEPWPDPVCDSIGFPPGHPYVEYCWLPVVGPSCCWLLPRLTAGLDGHPEGYDAQLSALARDLRLGPATG